MEFGIFTAMNGSMRNLPTGWMRELHADVLPGRYSRASQQQPAQAAE